MKLDNFDEEMAQAERLFADMPDTLARFKAKWMGAVKPEEYPGFVMSYHVDSELGLYLLAESIKQQGTYPEFKILHV